MKNRKQVKIFTLIMVLLLILPLFCACGEEEETSLVPVVDVAAMELGNIEVTGSVVGTVKSSSTAYLYPKLAGEVSAVYVEVGDQVVVGQAICSIDNETQLKSASINMNAAASALNMAKTMLARSEVLYAEGAISLATLEEAQNGVLQAQAAYDGAALNFDAQYEYSTVTATVAGEVSEISVKEHDMISQQVCVAIVRGDGDLEVGFSVPEHVAASLAVDQVVRAEKDGVIFEGKIAEVSSIINQTSGLVSVKAMFPATDALMAGNVVKMEIVSARAENVYMLPIDSVYYEGGNPFVYVFADGKAVKTFVTVGVANDENIEIKSGLSADDEIIVSWNAGLYDGAVVESSEAE